MNRIAPVAAVLLVLGACSYFDRDVVPYRPPDRAVAAASIDGAELYSKDCAWCHGAAGTGTDRGPTLLAGTNGPALTDFVLSTGRMPISNPRERSIGGPPKYSDEQIRAIVQHVDSLGAPGPDVPEIETESASVAEGLELYQSNCAACHAPTGIGGALTTSQRAVESGIDPGIIAPELFDLTPVQIAEAVRTGPGTMPVFGDGTFDEHELAALVAYTDYLDEAPDAGGAPLGRVGPVTEGAAGWVVGIVLLLLFARWLGTRAGEP